VTVFGFSRDRYRAKRKERWPTVSLGVITDRKYVSRSIKLFRALILIVKDTKAIRSVDRLYARNLDMALLALLARFLLRAKVPLTYEVLDIVPILQGRGLKSRILRSFERYILRACDELVVSSPAFMDGYFSAVQHYSGRWSLIENKLAPHQLEGHKRTRGEAAANQPVPQTWRLGWFGTLKSEKSLRSLVRAAELLAGELLVNVWGIFTTFSRERAIAIVNESTYVHYHGPYSADTDLPHLYGSVDLVWCGDVGTINEFNDRLLRPNRLYEAAYFGVPQIAVRGNETANRIEEWELGWVLPDASVESIVAFIKGIKPSFYSARVNGILAQPEEKFVESSDIESLVRDWGLRFSQ